MADSPKTIPTPPSTPQAALATLSAEQQQRIAELRGMIAAVAESTARADALAARREGEEAHALAEGLIALAERASPAATARLRDAAANNAHAQTALRLAAEELTGPIPGVGGGPWRLMWDAARTFVEESGSLFPPSAGSPCPLCLQTVSTDAADRLTHFHAHVSSTNRVRTSWERAVEERLFAGVVERFERDVKTLQLKDVKVTNELIGEVERGMTRASMFLHEDAFAAQVSLPSLAEMSNDLDMLRQFERATRRTGS